MCNCVSVKKVRSSSFFFWGLYSTRNNRIVFQQSLGPDSANKREEVEVIIENLRSTLLTRFLVQ